VTSAKHLTVLLAGQVVGRVSLASGTLRFTYDDAWRTSPGAYPLSLSMPLTAATHPHGPVSAYLWGLLPDNQGVLDRWARRFQVSARSPFALLGHVGEECAGAVQFVLPDRVESLLAEAPRRTRWLDESELARRLRELRADPAASRRPTDTGQFSLAGAQPKTALLFEGGRWGVPSGRVPTTHILKPPGQDLAGHAENEHFCLTLARALGLPTATSEVRRFEDEIAIVIERYDRLRAPGKRILRVHQEDLCQSLAVPPTSKYQSEGGPSPGQVAGLLRACSTEPARDVETFLDALAFNWLIAGTDGHAKNYSLLLAPGPQVRLAPLYDLASALPYSRHHPKLAMKLGGSYLLRDITGSEWRKAAVELQMPVAATLERVAAQATRLATAAPQVRDQLHAEGLGAPIVTRLAEALIERARRCVALL
jgi:serine/threonine-protein kinase HipA